MLTIITGNLNKLADFKAVLAPIEVDHLNLDLDEIQSLDPKLVIEHKLRQAMSLVPNKEFLLDDRSLSIESMGGLPGPFVKWFLGTTGIKKLAEYALLHGQTKATARSYIGYTTATGEMYFFEGVMEGSIVMPRGDLSYGWDPIFLPDGYDKTYGEMGRDEISKISHYRKSMDKFKEFYIK